MNGRRISPVTTKFFLITLAALVVFAPAARAWNHVGHRVVAELAWRRLSANERQTFTDLLKQHPHYRKLLVADVPAGVDTNEWAFLTAAVWPDMIRKAKPGDHPKPVSITQYDLYPHAIGYPFLRRGDTNRALLENFFIARPDAEMVLSNSLATLRDQQASAADRAVSLCWVLHLTGDLHQPLHDANIVTKERPGGDQLGGLFIVRYADGKQINLHSFWDQLGGVDRGYKPIASLANALMASPALKLSALPEYRDDKTIASWVQEGFRIAVDFAYSEDHVRYVRIDAIESGKVSASEIPVMSSDYIGTAHEIANRRMVLAGARLADELKTVRSREK